MLRTITRLRNGSSASFVLARKTGCSTTPQMELSKLSDEKGNIDLAKLDYLIPWIESLPEECRKPRRS